MSSNKTIGVGVNNEMDVCADCGQTNPTWASINHGILVCDQCAIIHRSLGRFISQMKSLRATDWRASQLQMVYDLYRSGSNSIWEHTLLDPHVYSSVGSGGGGGNVLKGFTHRKKPSPNDPLHPNKNDFIRAKYQSFAYVNKSHSFKDDSESDSDISEQLHSSVRTPNLKTSLRLLAAGANPNYIHSEKYNSPLHMAAKSGQMSQIELLLVYGANLGCVDSRGKSAIDYAREAGHNEIVNRLIEHQFDVPDALTRFICQGRQPNHQNGEHFLFVDIRSDFLNIGEAFPLEPDASQNSIDLFRRELHQSIQSLSHKSFQELSRDIYDEIERREINSFVYSFYGNENGKLPPAYQQLIVPFLPVYQFFSSTRNQGRQKLALLNTKEFTLLIIDVLNEIRRRVYGLGSTKSGDFSSRVDSSEFDDDSEPLYDSVPSEGDYDECNEIVSPLFKLKFDDATLVTSNTSGSLAKPTIPSAATGVNKDFVSMTEYSILKEQMFKSTSLMEEFLNENKEMRGEIARLQTIVEKLVEENVQLRQLIIPSKQNSLNSLHNNANSTENKSNSVLIDEPFSRNSFLRGSNRVRPQSVTGSTTNNRHSNEGISMKSPSTILGSHSPSKTSNSSLLNFQSSQPAATAQLQTLLGPTSNQFGVSQTFVNSANSSTSSLSSQSNQITSATHHQLSYTPPTSGDATAILQPKPNYSGQLSNASGSSSSAKHPTSLSRSASLSSSSSTYPSKDDIIKKIEFITNGIKELLSSAREGKHDEFRLCSERICNYVSEMICLFPESVDSNKIDNLLQINQSLILLQTNALRLHEECQLYEMPNSYNKPAAVASNQDYRFLYNNVIDKAADVASSVKSIVNLYTVHSNNGDKLLTDRMSYT